jgi:hypothetical protein
MLKTFLGTAFSISLFVSLASLADAQATRTWVSGVGDDANPCSRTAPCKTFAGAISKTAGSGEINCLDPGGFGAVTITKSITIDCTGTLAGILAAGTNGVIINITGDADAKKTVILRGLNINGAGTGIRGIRIVSAARVFVEKLVIDGFIESGISVENAMAGQIFIGESSIRNNAKAGVSASPSVAADVAVVKCLIAGNGTGVLASQNAAARISGNSILHNTTGIAANSGGRIASFRDNVIEGNGTNGAPTSTTALQ